MGRHTYLASDCRKVKWLVQPFLEVSDGAFDWIAFGIVRTDQASTRCPRVSKQTRSRPLENTRFSKQSCWSGSTLRPCQGHAEVPLPHTHQPAKSDATSTESLGQPLSQRGCFGPKSLLQPFSRNHHHFKNMCAGVAEAGPFSGFFTTSHRVHARLQEKSFVLSPNQSFALLIEPQPDRISGRHFPIPASSGDFAAHPTTTQTFHLAPPAECGGRGGLDVFGDVDRRTKHATC